MGLIIGNMSTSSKHPGGMMQLHPLFSVGSKEDIGDATQQSMEHNNTGRLIDKFGEQVTQCFTCTNGCIYKVGSPPSPCRCDSLCKHFGDCCLDYEEVCEYVTNNTLDSMINKTKVRETLPLAEFIHLTEMVKLQIPLDDSDGAPYYRIVNQCPRHSQNVHGNDKEICESLNNPNPNDLLFIVPISANTLIYKNIYCAKCHEVPLQEMTVWEMTIICPVTQMNHGKETMQEDGVDAFLKFVSDKKCKLKFESPQDEYTTRWSLADIHQMCNKKESEMFKYCTSYSSPVVMIKGEQRVIYRNEFCAICDNFTSTDVQCMFSGSNSASGKVPPGSGADNDGGSFGGLIPGNSFSLLLDLSGGAQLSNQNGAICPPGQVHDVIFDTCRTTLCSQHACLNGFNITLSQPLENIKPEYSLLIQVFPEIEQRPFTTPYSINNVINSVRSSLEYIITATEYTDCSMLPEIRILTLQSNNISACWLIIFKPTKAFVLTHNQLEYTLGNLGNQIELHLMNYNIFKYPVCKEGVLNAKENIIFLQILGINYASTSYLNSTFYILDDVPIHMSGENSSNRINALLCEIPTCEKVLLTKDEIIKGPSGILINTKAGSVNVSSRDYVSMANGSLLVCQSVVTIGESNSTIIPNTAMLVLSSIGSAISLLALLITLVTYLIFPKLQTIPGKCVMSLTICLFLAQLVFLINPVFVASQSACVAIAAINHGLWLAVFCWMNVLAFDLSSTFANMSKIANIPQNIKRFFVYSAYAWSLPLQIVVICLVLHFTDITIFQYGSSTLCWISGFWPLLGAFGIPVLTIICANFILFVRAAIYLHAAMKIAKRARSDKNDHHKLILYIKLSSLMGFTWVFGFLANINALDFLWYIFIIFNSIQGVYIFLTFSFTKRIRAMWIEKVWKRDKQEYPSTTKNSYLSSVKKGKTMTENHI